MKYYMCKSSRFMSYVPGCPEETVWVVFATKADIDSKAWDNARFKAFAEQYPVWECPYGKVKSKLDHMRHCWSTPTGGEFIEITEEVFEKMMKR